MDEKISPLAGQVLRKVDLGNSNEGDYSTENAAPSERPISTIDEATVITSEVANSECFGGLHRPVLDLDMPIKVLPSSTPGHHHLLIDKEMTWQQYAYLLDTLVAAGLIEPGYRNASVERGWTCVRLPWIRKGEPTKTPFVTSGNMWLGDDEFRMAGPKGPELEDRK